MAYHLTPLIILFIFYKNVRTKFLSYKFIFFIIPTIVLLLPHLYWNYINSFVTFNHTADNANFQKIVININRRTMSSQKFILETFCMLLGNIPETEEEYRKDFQNIGDTIAHTAPEVIHTAW